MTTLTQTLTTPITAVQDDYCTEPPVKPDVSPVAEEIAKLVFWSNLEEECVRLMRQCKAWQRDLVLAHRNGCNNGVVWQIMVNTLGTRWNASHYDGDFYRECIPFEMLPHAARLLEEVLAICDYMEELFYPAREEERPLGKFAGNNIDLYA